MNGDLQDFYTYVGQTSEESMAIEVAQGKGSYLYSPSGKAYLDFISGICVSNIGHGDPDIIQSIWHQTRSYLHPIVYGEGVFSPQVKYAKALSGHLAEPLSNVYFTNSGSEAIEAAMKIAKKYTGRTQLVACHNAYHGSTQGAMSISGDPQAKKGYEPLLPEILHIPYNEVSALQQITEDTAAFIVEPIQGAGGAIVPEEGYLLAVQERCKEVGALFLLDEIQTGFGRTGSMFAHEAVGIIPDLLILAKALGGGLPLGALVTSKKILSCIQKDPPLGHISTFGGHPLSCAAGLTLFNKLKHGNILNEVEKKETYLTSHLRHPRILELRGRGLLYGAIFPDESFTRKLGKALLEKGLITIGFLSEPCGLRISPPLTISIDELAWGVNCFLETIEEI